MFDMTKRLIVIMICICTAGQAWAQEPASDVQIGTLKKDFESLDQLREYYSDRMEKIRQAVEQQRLDALQAFLNKAPDTQKEQIYADMIQSAMLLEKYEMVLSLTETFARNFPDSDDLWSSRFARYDALISMGKIGQAYEEWKKATEEVSEVHLQPIFQSGMLIADAFILELDKESAKKVYDSLEEKLTSFAPEINGVLKEYRGGLSWVGKKPPALEGRDMKGNPVKLEDYKGKVVFIDFWATWCPPCMAALPELEELYAQYHEQGFEVVGISLDQEVKALKDFLDKRELPWRTIYDGYFTGPNTSSYNVQSIPSVFVINKDGLIVRKGKPFVGYEPMIRHLLKQKTTGAQ